MSEPSHEQDWREKARIWISALSHVFSERPAGSTRTGRDVLSHLYRWIGLHPDSGLRLFRHEVHGMLKRHNPSSHPSACEVLARIFAATYLWSEEGK